MSNDANIWHQHYRDTHAELQKWKQHWFDLDEKRQKLEAEVERLRANLRRAAEIADELETLPYQTADNTTNSMKKYWELRAELVQLEATLNQDKK